MAALERKLRGLERRRSYARRIDAISTFWPGRRAARLSIVPLLVVAAGVWRGSAMLVTVGVVLLAAVYVVGRGQRVLARERLDHGTSPSAHCALDAEIDQMRRDLQALREGPDLRGSPQR